MAGDLIDPVSKRPSPQIFNCPSCGAGVQIRAIGQTVSVACRGCGSVIDAADPNHKIISTAARKIPFEPLIPLGQRGKLHGTLWEVIGFMQKCDSTGIYHWREYLLFNPTRGFHWLTEFDGHWNYVTPVKEKPIVYKTAQQAKCFGKTYTLFHQGTAKVTYVLGEFYWRVKTDDKSIVEDYINPPEILSCEKNEDEITWSIGEYVSADDVKEAFQIAKPMPQQTGVAPNQLSTISTVAPGIKKYWLQFFAVLLVFQLIAMMLSKNDTVYDQTLLWNAAEKKIESSPPFELKYGLANVSFELSSPVQNSWLEADVELIDDKNGKVYSFEQGVQYYSGRDSDGSWSEGSRTHRVILSAIPAGTYHLNVQASAEPSSKSISYRLIVKRDVTTWSNFNLALILLSLYPIFVWWRNRKFELKRWSQSDFSPYWKHKNMDEEDD